MSRIAGRPLWLTLNIVLVLFLAGCKGVPLTNGDVKNGLTGKANSEKKYTITITAPTDALMVQAAGSDNVSLQVVDENDQAVTYCSEPNKCLATNVIAGKYTVKLAGMAAYSNVSLSAAWANASTASLQNNTARILPPASINAVGLNSFYMPVSNIPAKIQLTGADAANIRLDVMDAEGSQVSTCAAGLNCIVTGLNSGVYFLRHTATADYADISLTMSWGGADSATMQNGVPLTNLTGNSGSLVWNSFYIPANTRAFALQGSRSSDYSIDVYGPNGELIDSCGYYDTCSTADPTEGLYSVAVRFHRYVSSMSLVASWVGPTVSTLSNGVSLPGLSGETEQMLLHSLYIPAGVEQLAVQVANLERGFVEILDSNGYSVESCAQYDLCVLSNPASGGYFVRLRFEQPQVGVSLTAAWVSPTISTLSNGVTKSGLSGEAGFQVLQSIYLPAGVEDLAVQLSGLERGFAEIVDRTGYPVAACDRYNLCHLSNPTPGSYFVRIRFDQPQFGVSLVATWAGPSAATLQNGVPLTGLSGQTGSQALQSLYIPTGVADLAMQLSGLERGFAEIVDRTGYPVAACDRYNLCHLSNPTPGSYFVRIRFDQPQFGVSLVATWAGPSAATLQNGVPLTGLSGQTGSQALQSLYIPTGVADLAVQLSGLERGFAEIVDRNGYPVAACDRYNPCHLSNPIPGSYFVRIRFDQPQSGVSLVAAWAGPSVATLQNGVPLSGLSGQTGYQALQSLYIPTGVANLAVQLSGLERGFAEIVDRNGYPVAACDRYNPCHLSNPAPGSYFVRIRFDQPQSGVSLVAAWAGPSVATLFNGIILSGLSGQTGQQLLHSLYLPEGVNQLAVQLSGMERGFAEILDANGYPIAACDSYTPCSIEQPMSGAYFVRLRFDAAQSNVGVQASW